MLAQGQSSSAKRGGLAADVSSGLIFLKKKKEKEIMVVWTMVAGKREAFGFEIYLDFLVIGCRG